MNRIFYLAYGGIVAVLFILFFIGPAFTQNKFFVLGMLIVIFLVMAFFFERGSLERSQKEGGLKVERGVHFFSKRLVFYLIFLMIALLAFYGLSTLGIVEKITFKDDPGKGQVMGTSVSCIDNDLQDFQTKGSVQLFINDVGQAKEYDICIDSGTLRERVCEGTKLSYITKSCTDLGEGGTCEDGKCLVVPPDDQQNLSTNENTSNDSSSVNASNLPDDNLPVNPQNNSMNNRTTPDSIVIIEDVENQPPLITNLKLHPDNFTQEGSVDDDTQIFVTWDLKRTADTTCFGAFGDPNTISRVGTGGMDVSTALSGWNIYYLRCCNDHGCDSEQAVIKVII